MCLWPKLLIVLRSCCCVCAIPLSVQPVLTWGWLHITMCMVDCDMIWKDSSLWVSQGYLFDFSQNLDSSVERIQPSSEINSNSINHHFFSSNWKYYPSSAHPAAWSSKDVVPDPPSPWSCPSIKAGLLGCQGTWLCSSVALNFLSTCRHFILLLFLKLK